MGNATLARPGRTAAVWAVVVFTLTGLCLLPVYLYRIDLTGLSMGTSEIPVIAGVGILLTAYVPSIAALLTAWLLPHSGGVRTLLRPLRRWRVAWRWYALGLVGPVVLFLLGRILLDVVGGRAPERLIVLPAAATVGGLVGSLVAGAVGEELGWRGLGQRQLQLRIPAVWAAVVVGLLWGAWHLWPLTTPGGWTASSPSEVAITLARLIATSAIYAWIFNRTGGSVLLVMVAHTGHNIANAIIPSVTGDHFDVVVALLYVAAAIALVFFTGRTLGQTVQPQGAGSPPS